MKNKNLLIALAVITMLAFSCKRSANKNIVTLTDSNFQTETAQGVVLVDFWATWCMPCRAMATVIDELANHTVGKVKVCKLDVDANPAVSNQYGIRSIPTIIIFKDGKPTDTLVGVQSKVSLITALSKHVTIE